MSALYVGQEVVCIETPPVGGYGDEIPPSKNEHYTIRAIGYHECTGPNCLLVELVNKVRSYRVGKMEPPIPQEYFRPVRHEQIQIFRDMCVRKVVPVSA